MNEHYSSELAHSKVRPQRRFQYRYAMFSAKGFKPDAQGYALAHHISLIDLSGPAFVPLVKAVNGAATSALRIAKGAGLTSFPVREARLAIRQASAEIDSGGKPSSEPAAGGILPARELASWARHLTADLNRTSSGEGLILGFPAAPFVLAMRPASMEALEDYISRHGPEIQVEIGFHRAQGVAGDWTITPRDDPSGFALSFGLPGALETWLLAAPEEAMQAKEMFMSNISLFLETKLVRLLFTPSVVPPSVDEPADDAEAGQGTDAADMSFLRRARTPEWPHVARARDYRHVDVGPAPEYPDAGPTGWTVRSVEALMRALDAEGRVQAELIRTAARQGGTLTRNDVYAIAEFPPDRTLRGLTRPTRRITGALIDAGVLPEDAEYPFQADYVKGVLATHFWVPPDVVEALRALGPPLGA